LEDFRRFEPVDFVENHQSGLSGSADFFQHTIHCQDLVRCVGMTDVNHVQEEFSLDNLFERCLEGFHQAMRQFADETHGVGQENILIGGQMKPAGGWIESGEQFVFRQGCCTRQRIEQGGFASVGIANDRRKRPEVPLPSFSLRSSLAAHSLEFDPDSINPLLDFAAVGFELGFAFATTHADAAFLSGKVTPESGQAWKQVLELSQFHLELAFPGASTAGKNVEDKGSPIENLAFEDGLERPALGRRQFVIKDDGIDIIGAAKLGEFSGLAGANERAGHGRLEFLRAAPNDLATGSSCQFFEFGHGILNVPGRAILEFGADEKDALGRFPRCFN
jgi:hypothetical protein